jgi:hypothetical protein
MGEEITTGSTLLNKGQINNEVLKKFLEGNNK